MVFHSWRALRDGRDLRCVTWRLYVLRVNTSRCLFSEVGSFVPQRWTSQMDECALKAVAQGRGHGRECF